MPRRRPSKARKIGDFPPFRQPPARCDGVKTPMKTLRVFHGLPRLRSAFFANAKIPGHGFGSTVDAGYRGRAAPCQRERSDRALYRVTATDNQSLRRFPDTRRCPPFGLLAEAVPQQPRAGNRPVSGARPALWTYSREHRDMWSRQTAAAPPQPAQPFFR